MDRFTEFVTNEWALFLAAAVILSLIAYGLYKDLTKKHKSLIPVRAVTLMNEEDSVIVDVREAKEFNEGHIEKAINLPFEKLTDRMGELEKFKNKTLLVTCRTGARSAMACEKLSKQGFGNLYCMETGIDGWKEANLPMTKKKK